jgi:hypothetical protein
VQRALLWVRGLPRGVPFYVTFFGDEAGGGVMGVGGEDPFLVGVGVDGSVGVVGVVFFGAVGEVPHSCSCGLN